MKKLIDGVVVLCFVLSVGCHSTVAISSDKDNSVQSLPEIQEAVRSYVLSQHPGSTDIDVAVKPLDDRLRLRACDQPLSAFWSPGSRMIGRVTVQVECISPKPWRVHVQSTVTFEGLVWILNKGVRRGDVLTRDMLSHTAVKIGANNPALRSSSVPILDLEPWIGFAFSQRVSTGMVLDERMLKPPMLVSKGEAVLIVHESLGLHLQTKGVALSSATMGKRVQVRNVSSGKIVEATAVAHGLVKVLN